MYLLHALLCLLCHALHPFCSPPPRLLSPSSRSMTARSASPFGLRFSPPSTCGSMPIVNAATRPASPRLSLPRTSCPTARSLAVLPQVPELIQNPAASAAPRPSPASPNTAAHLRIPTGARSPPRASPAAPACSFPPSCSLAPPLLHSLTGPPTCSVACPPAKALCLDYSRMGLPLTTNTSRPAKLLAGFLACSEHDTSKYWLMPILADGPPETWRADDAEQHAAAPPTGVYPYRAASARRCLARERGFGYEAIDVVSGGGAERDTVGTRD
ncbi:uncharacterized protein B0H18DRAFT_35980 [Fomitopsis serialis]|uniref:uncharacterized protein n=1 Tax=Fomitopsis serialis TaxID=139415 RepID=UPI002007334C|nr:uncharacterized protein B0H18DRAFT_35980 [Neoantrodia serialis]KAH9917415.1 hypothetical protein B0H18DRAFT_35980 [Neoantrodia serialis]